MQRFPDWHSRLEQYLHAQTLREFRYGEFDCFLFVSEAVMVMTGIDPAASYRGLYRSRKEARRLLSRSGGFTRVFGNCGMKETSFLNAARGDVLQTGAFSLGLMGLDGRRVVMLSDHLALTTPDSKARAWHV